MERLELDWVQLIFRSVLSDWLRRAICKTLSVEGTVKSSLELSKSFQIFLPNQKLARALTSIPKAIAPANTSCCLATSGRNPRAQYRLAGGISTSTSAYSPDCYSKVVGHGLLWSPFVPILDSIMLV